MPDIYEQHAAAFKNVSAFVVLHKGERVANIAFKFPKDGAGRLYVYIHWIGTPMVRGHATGYGYDKRTAACAAAAQVWQKKTVAACRAAGTSIVKVAEERDTELGFWSVLNADRGPTWDSALHEAGFTVLQAV